MEEIEITDPRTGATFVIELDDEAGVARFYGISDTTRILLLTTTFQTATERNDFITWLTQQYGR